jgi:hypothetical protein
MRPLDLLWRWYDWLYLRIHRVRDLPIPGGAVLWLSLPRYRGRRLVLSDGTVIRPGERVGVLHLHNDAVAALHSPDGSPHQGVMALLERFRVTMRMVARELAAGSLADVRAVTATTVLFAGLARAGFDVVPLKPRCWARVVGRYQRGLMTRHHPRGKDRAKLERFVEARAAWISREALLRRYGPPARSVERETTA